MGRYNEFIAEVTCPHCTKAFEATLQADIGVLEYHRFRKGEKIFGIPREMKKSPVGPAPQLEDGRTDFWGIGIERCPHCEGNLWVKIYVHDNTFDKIQVLDHEVTDYPFPWGELK